MGSTGLFSSIGVGGSLSDFGLTRTCCERNRDNIRRLEKRLDFVRNDMGDRFKDEFDQIDDVLDDFERRIDDLELRREANVRDVFELDDRVIRLDSDT